MLINLLKGREVAVKSEIEYIFRKHLNETRPTKRAKEGLRRQGNKEKRQSNCCLPIINQPLYLCGLRKKVLIHIEFFSFPIDKKGECAKKRSVIHNRRGPREDVRQSTKKHEECRKVSQGNGRTKTEV